MTLIPDQASQALNANLARSLYNVDGAGLTVGILSDSFDTSGNADTMATDIANGYLPTDTRIIQDMPAGTDEGRGMAQIVHEIAPGASILFATAAIGAGVVGQQNYAANIRALAAAGAKVIVDDYIYFEDPSYQDGIVAQAIADVVAQGVIYLSAASNDGPNGYEAPFNAGSATITHGGHTETLHDFAPGNHQLAVTFLAGQTGTVYFDMQWASPAASASPGNGATSDLDLFLVDGSGHVVAAKQTSNIGGDPLEVMAVDLSTVSGTYYLEVGLRAGTAPADFRIIGSDNDGGVFATLEHVASSISQSTFFGHFASSDVIAVGAAKYTQTPAFGQTPPHKEPFSTFGPSTVYYDVNGNLLPTPQVRTIAVTGVDNADTSFFGDSDFDHDGFRNFAGTSAAAPSVAAVVALMLQANAALTSDDARHLLQDAAITMPVPNATGAGLVQADRAVGFAATHIITAYADGGSTLLGTHLAESLVGSSAAEIFTGYGGADTFTGGGGADQFRDIAANLSGSTITDFAFRDLINLTDLAFSLLDTASFADATRTLTIDSHSGTSAQIFLPNFTGGVFGLSQDAVSGIDIALLVNQAPLVDLHGAATSYTAGAAAIAIAPAASVSGTDSTDFNGGLLRAAVTGNGGSEDQLSILTDSVVALAGGNVSVNGAVIGTIDPAHNGVDGQTLVVNFTTSDATPAAAALLMAHIGYADDALGASTAARTVTFTINDGDGSANGGDPTGSATATVNVALPQVFGTPGDDSYAAPVGNARIDAGGGVNTISFNFKLTDATVSFAGNQAIVDGPGSHTVLTGFDIYKFTDGTVHENDGDPLVDDLYYYTQNHDVWLAGVDADAHYHTVGWHEGLDPDAFFSTSTYLSLYPAVKAAGVDPLLQFDQSGWQSGNDPSIAFDTAAYLAANPDVKAAGVDPLAQFLTAGASEQRQPIAPTVLLASNGFDYVYYLQHNPDVAAAHIDPLAHYETTGWKEGRNPNAYFDDSGYLAHNADVAAAGVNPLDHYDQFGWHEGRNPSVNFDTDAYLSHYPDVAAAGIDPLVHFLQHGMAEGRLPFGSGVWA